MINTDNRYESGVLLCFLYLLTAMKPEITGKENSDTSIILKELMPLMDPSGGVDRHKSAMPLVFATRVKDEISKNKAKATLSNFSKAIQDSTNKSGLDAISELFQRSINVKNEVESIYKLGTDIGSAIEKRNTEIFIEQLEIHGEDSEFEFANQLAMDLKNDNLYDSSDNAADDSVFNELTAYHDKVSTCIAKELKILKGYETLLTKVFNEKASIKNSLVKTINKLENKYSEIDQTTTDLSHTINSISTLEENLVNQRKNLRDLRDRNGPIDSKWRELKESNFNRQIASNESDLKKTRKSEKLVKSELDTIKAEISKQEQNQKDSEEALDKSNENIKSREQECVSATKTIEAFYQSELEKVERPYVAQDLCDEIGNKDLDWKMVLGTHSFNNLSKPHKEYLRIRLTEFVKEFENEFKNDIATINQYLQGQKNTYVQLRNIQSYFREVYRAGDLLQIDILCNTLLQSNDNDLRKVLEIENSELSNRLHSIQKFDFDLEDAYDSDENRNIIEELLIEPTAQEDRNNLNDTRRVLADIYLRIVAICVQSIDFQTKDLPFWLFNPMFEPSVLENKVFKLETVENFLICLMAHSVNNQRHNNILKTPVFRETVPQEIIEYLLHHTTYEKLENSYNTLFPLLSANITSNNHEKLTDWEEFQKSVDMEGSVLFKMASDIGEHKDGVNDFKSYYTAIDKSANTRSTRNVFICYARSDAVRYQKHIKGELENYKPKQGNTQSIHVFVDTSIERSEPWLQAITHMLALSDSVVIILSENSLIQHLYGKVFIRNLEARHINKRMSEGKREGTDQNGTSPKLYIVNTAANLDRESNLVQEVYGRRVTEYIRDKTDITPSMDEFNEGEINHILNDQTIAKILE